MIAALLVVIVLLIAVAFALACRSSALKAELLATQADSERLAQSVRHNLRALRVRLGYAFPEAVAVCDCLESTLQARCRADLEMIERKLILLRRAHNAAILDAAKSGEPYRTALADLLALLREKDSTWLGEWEQLERFDAVLLAERSVEMPWGRIGVCDVASLHEKGPREG